MDAVSILAALPDGQPACGFGETFELDRKGGEHMTGEHEDDVAALHSLDELKALKEELRKAAVNLEKLASALRDPAQWRLKPEAPLGYGKQSAQDVHLPNLKALGEKVLEYQHKHHSLTIKLGNLSPSVRKMVDLELERL